MLGLPTDETQPQRPVKVLITGVQLQEVMEGRAIDLDRTGATIERRVLKEDDLVEGMHRDGGRPTNGPTFIPSRTRGRP
jgi:hypothetical protein